MARNISGLSPREAEFLSRLAATGKTVFHYHELRDCWGDGSTARRTMSRLHQGGWLKRIERGCYALVPLAAGPDRHWSENALVVASQLAAPGAVAYWSALSFWNLTEQLPRTVFVQSPRRKFSAQLTVGGVLYRFVHITPARFFGLTERMVASQSIVVTDREKTLVDSIDRPALSGGIRQVAQVLESHADELDWAQLEAHLARFGSGALYKRLGYIVETLDLPIPDRRQRLGHWQDHLTAGLADLEPGERGCAAGDLEPKPSKERLGVRAAESGEPFVAGYRLQVARARRWRIRDNIDLAGRPRGQDSYDR